MNGYKIDHEGWTDFTGPDVTNKFTDTFDFSGTSDTNNWTDNPLSQNQFEKWNLDKWDIEKGLTDQCLNWDSGRGFGSPEIKVCSSPYVDEDSSSEEYIGPTIRCDPVKCSETKELNSDIQDALEEIDDIIRELNNQTQQESESDNSDSEIIIVPKENDIYKDDKDYRSDDPLLEDSYSYDSEYDLDVVIDTDQVSEESCEIPDMDSSDSSDECVPGEGKLELYIGPMFSGKSTAIILRIAKMADIGYDVLYVNHEMDVRDTEAQDSVVTTHNSQYTTLSKKINFAKVSQLKSIDFRDYQFIAVDEGQFFSDLKDAVLTWVMYGKTVMVSSLDGDIYRMKFGQVLDLIPHADKVKKLSASCHMCWENEKKLVSAPFTGSVEYIDGVGVGGLDKYRAMCRKCHDRFIESTM
jgi:thymidine kinase